MPRKRATDAVTKKASKQKKLVLALSLVLVLALAYAYRTVASLGSSHSVAPARAATTTTTPPTAPDSAAGSGAATSSAGGSASTGGSAASSADPAKELVAAVKPPADPGQLESFSRFASKDPFAASGPSPSVAPTAPVASSSGGGGSGSTSGGSGASGGGVAKPSPSAPSQAVIGVNGVAQNVTVGSDFPVSSDPAENAIFRLVALTRKTARIGVVGGSYASGQATLTLRVNEPVTLVNTADGKQYTLVLFPQGTAAPSGGSAPGAGEASAPTTTTTAPTAGG